MTEHVKIGEFTKDVINILMLDIEAGTPIYLGESNRKHMESRHPKEYKKYGGRLEKILSEPDYVGLRSDGTVEYIKAYGVHIKVAVRVASVGDYYARTLYRVDSRTANRLIEAGEWKTINTLE